MFFKERVAVVSRDRAERSGRTDVPQPVPAADSREDPSTASANAKAADEYAATGMGRRTDHAVTQVWLDLEPKPSQALSIRYEFRPQLVRLGVVPAPRTDDPLDRRERARGFEPGFSPEPPRLR